MAIFGNLELESIVQVNDKTRLDARKSFISKGEGDVTLVEIEFDTGGGYIDVTGDIVDNTSDDWYLDYQYASDGVKTVTVRITTDGSPATVSKDITVITAADDKLFSSDDELTAHEPDIMSWVQDGRNSFLDIHRLSQDRILTFLDEQRIHDDSGDKLTKAAIIDIQEVNDWSKFLTLKFIFEGLSNAVEDIFDRKAQKYHDDMVRARNRGVLRIDRNASGTAETDKDMRTFRMVRR